MNKNTAKNYIRIPRQEYVKLKHLQERFESFWDYFRHIEDIRQARAEVRSGKTVSQEKLFNALGL